MMLIVDTDTKNFLTLVKITKQMTCVNWGCNKNFFNETDVYIGDDSSFSRVWLRAPLET